MSLCSVSRDGAEDGKSGEAFHSRGQFNGARGREIGEKKEKRVKDKRAEKRENFFKKTG